MKKNIIIGILLSLLILLAGCGGNITGESIRDTEGPIKIGFIGPLTGEAAAIGEGALDALEMSVGEINAKGGVNGRQLKIIPEDGKCDGKESVNIANKLVNMDKVSVIVGGQCSAETLAAAPMAEEGKTVLLSPCSSAPKVSDAGDYVFRLYPSDSFQGIFFARHAFEKLGFKKAGILYTNGDWGIGVKDSFKKEFLKIGGEIVAEEAFEQDSTDMRTQLTKIMSKDPDFLYIPAYSQGAGLILKQANELGITIPKLGADAADDPNMIEIAGEAAEGFKFTIVAAVPPEEITAKYESTYGHGFGVCGIQAYDAGYVVAEVMSKVGTDATAIKDALYSIDYAGASGRIRLDENGDLKGAEYQIKEVINGEFVVIQ